MSEAQSSGCGRQNSHTWISARESYLEEVWVGGRGASGGWVRVGERGLMRLGKGACW